ncbi:hypothetical protein PGS1_22451 [Enterobacter cloacae subsp. cloacae GS1]|nr:hypothetical protein PGS1_22451 [Enterobacter cloacae subsp. cloacae GS1]
MAALVYVLAICAANYLVFVFGPWWSIINSFVLIGLDFILRDVLHERIGFIKVNGAFSAWDKSKKKKIAVDWGRRSEKFYDFVGKWFSRIEWFLIPDVIEGSEEENDEQLELVPHWLASKAVPVWHSDESIERLVRLSDRYEWVAIGCCGPHRHIRSKWWEHRMNEVFTELYINRNSEVKLHGLRMLDVRVLGMYPFASADSTNVAINVPKTEKRFPEITDKLARTAVLRAAIENVHPPSIPEWVERKAKEPAQAGFLFEFTDAA